MAARRAAPKRATAAGLPRLIRRLRAFHGAPEAPPSRDPYELLLWEQVAYLADHATRLAAYRLLESTVGTKPTDILRASDHELRAVTRCGGAVAVTERAARLRFVAERVDRVWKGNLRPVLRLPLAGAVRELKKYPAVGEAGAERILLLAGAYPVFGLDSNALRVLLRLGYGTEQTAWNRSYRSAQLAAGKELPQSVAVRTSAYLVLRHHGQTLCRRAAPMCEACPLRADCPTGRPRTD